MIGLILAFLVPCGDGAEPDARLPELNRYWAELSRTVREGDIDGYRATCHKDAVLVSGTAQSSHPLAKAISERWAQGFADTKAGKIKADVAFRFSRRWGDETTAHETGMFHYHTVDAEGQRTDAYVHFEGLLVKDGRWRILMEYQKSQGTETEWNALAGSK